MLILYQYLMKTLKFRYFKFEERMDTMSQNGTERVEKNEEIKERGFPSPLGKSPKDPTTSFVSVC